MIRAKRSEIVPRGDVSDSLSFRLLGGLTISRAGQPVSGFHSRKERALLCYLAVTKRSHRRPHLAGLLWGDLPDTRAMANLRRALSHLRGVARDHLVITRQTVLFDPGSAHWLDVDAFERLAARSADRAALEEAADLYHGDFLAGFYLKRCPDFEEWVLVEQERLRGLVGEALRTLMALHGARGDYRAAVTCGRRLLTLDPWREEIHRELMRLLALGGQRSAALTQYRACCRLLKAELGLDPLEETTALYTRLVAGDGVSVEAAEFGTDPSATRPALELPFVGRGGEHAALVRSWDAVQRDGRGLTLVEGEAGVGKTRLVREVSRYTESEGSVVLRGRCYEFGGDVPYQPIAEALRTHLLDSPGLTLSLSPTWLAELSRLVPELKERQSKVPDPAQDPGEGARQRLFQAVTQFLITHPAGTLLLFLDDLHWADQSTLDLLHFAVRRLGSAPVWIVGTYRPEEVTLGHRLTRLRQGLARDGMVERVRLEPLAPEAVGEIARWLVGREQGPSLGDVLYRESEGNPFILREVVEDLQELGALQPRRPESSPAPRADDRAAPWEWRKPLAKEVLPTGVREVILQRVGRLDEESRRLLSMAAVVGRRFDRRLLQRASDEARAAVERAMDEWLSRRLVQPSLDQPSRSPGSHAYDFAHDKIRAVVYEAVESGRRRDLHQRVASALERVSDQVAGREPGRLARHWEEAGRLEQAATYWLQAGDQARLLYANEEAASHYRRALSCLREIEGDERAARTLMKLGLAYHNAFNFDKARKAYDQGFTLWRRSGHQSLLGARKALRGRPLQTLRARWLEPSTLDPAMAPDSHTDHLLTALFSGLTELGPDLEPVPEAARAWEITDDGRCLVFHLMEGMVWTDGVPVTAHDFEYAWKRVLDPASESSAAPHLFDLSGAQAYHQGHGAREDVGVRAQDDLTLVVELEEAVAYFPQLLARPALFPVPRHVVEAEGDAWTKHDRFVSNGPFRLDTWQLGERLIFARNPRYHRVCGGNVERVELVPLTDWDERIRRYEADELDVLGITFLPLVQREEVRRRHADDYTSAAGLKTGFVAFDVTRPPFDDARVRRAFAMATDREALANGAMGGYVGPATGGFVPPGMPGHCPGIGLACDAEAARRLLAEAGYPKGGGFPTVRIVTCPAAEARIACVMAQWQDVLGVDIRWEALPWAEYLKRLSEDPPTIVDYTWAADYPDPDSFFRVCRSRTFGGWEHHGYDQLVAQARSVTDQEVRLELYRQADHVLVEEVPILPLTNGRQHLLIKPWVRRYPTSAVQSAFWKDAVIEPH